MSRSTLRRALQRRALCASRRRPRRLSSRPPLMPHDRRQRQTIEHPDRQPRVRQGQGREPGDPPHRGTADPARSPLGDPRPHAHQPRGQVRPARPRPRTAQHPRSCAPEHRRDALLGRLNVYRQALASWYGPGLFGNHLGCGGTLQTGSLGVANKSLPCGTKVTLRHRGRVLRVRVIDRGPYVGAREYDLTAATARKLGFSGHGPIQVTK